jgi:hypothetical protein
MSFEAGLRSTSTPTRYVTGALSFEGRWYVLPWLGLSFVLARVEGGFRVGNQQVLDDAPGVHGSQGSQYFFQAGSRLGVAVSAGLLDLLIQAPTLAWQEQPFSTREILSGRLALRFY